MAESLFGPPENVEVDEQQLTSQIEAMLAELPEQPSPEQLSASPFDQSLPEPVDVPENETEEQQQERLRQAVQQKKQRDELGVKNPVNEAVTADIQNKWRFLDPQSSPLNDIDPIDNLERVIGLRDDKDPDKDDLIRVSEQLKQRREDGDKITHDDVLWSVTQKMDERLSPVQRLIKQNLVLRSIHAGAVDSGATIMNTSLRTAGGLAALFGAEETGENLDKRADANNRVLAEMSLLDQLRNNHSLTAKVFGPTTANMAAAVTQTIGPSVFGGFLGKASKLAKEGGTAAARGTAILFGAQATDRAITEGRDNGLSGGKLAAYATGQGALEAGIMLTAGAIARKRGISTMEEVSFRDMSKVFQQTMARSGADKAFKIASGIAKGGAAEGTEEAVTELAQALWGKVFDQDDLENLPERLAFAFGTGFLGRAALGAPKDFAIKIQENVAANIDAIDFVAHSPEQVSKVLDSDITNKKEFESLTGIKRTNQDFRTAFFETVQTMVGADQQTDDSVGSAQKATEFQAANEARNTATRQAQGDPNAGQPTPQTQQEAVNQAAVAEQSKGFQNTPTQNITISPISPETGKGTAHVDLTTEQGENAGSIDAILETQNQPRLAINNVSITENTDTDRLRTAMINMAAQADKEGVPLTSGPRVDGGQVQAFESLIGNGYNIAVSPNTKHDAEQDTFFATDGGPVFTVVPDGRSQMLADVAKRQDELVQDVENNPDDYTGVTSLRFSFVDALREKLDLDRLMSPERLNFEQLLQEALQRDLDNDPINLAQSVLDGTTPPEAVSAVERAMFLARLGQLGEAFNARAAEAEAFQQNGDLTKLALADAAMERIKDEADKISEAARLAGSEAGFLLNLQKMAVDADMNLVAIRSRMRASKKDQLSPEDDAFAETVATEYRQADKRSKEVYEKVKQDAVNAAIQAVKADPQKFDRQSIINRIIELVNKGCDLQ